METNFNEVLDFLESEWSFFEKITQDRLENRANFWRVNWKMMEADLQILMFAYISNSCETKEEAKHIKKWASLMMEFYKKIYWMYNTVEKTKKLKKAIK